MAFGTELVRARQAVTRLVHGVRGSVDDVKDGKLSGWAYDQRRPMRRVVVQLREGSKVWAETVANLPRQDLVTVLPQGDGLHGFLLPLPQAGLADHFALDVRVKGTSTSLPNAKVVLRAASLGPSPLGADWPGGDPELMNAIGREILAHVEARLAVSKAATDEELAGLRRLILERTPTTGEVSGGHRSVEPDA